MQCAQSPFAERTLGKREFDQRPTCSAVLLLGAERNTQIIQHARLQLRERALNCHMQLVLPVTSAEYTPLKPLYCTTTARPETISLSAPSSVFASSTMARQHRHGSSDASAAAPFLMALLRPRPVRPCAHC